MKKLLTLFLLVTLIVSCDDRDQTCNVQDPINDLAWLKAKADELNKLDLAMYFYIDQATYKGETVFVINNCCPMCLSKLLVFNCSGVEIENPDPADIKNYRRIWASQNNECLFM